MGMNECFGLEEVVEDRSKRVKTVVCKSMTGQCYYISKEYFIHCVNQFKFSQQVIEEQIVKHQVYCNRMKQTHTFLKEFESE